MPYCIVDAPKFADMVEYDCALCAHEALTRPVFLSLDGAGATSYGTGCAAKLLGLPVTELVAQLAVEELRALVAADYRVTNAWVSFMLVLPARVTPKFIAEVAKHHFTTVEIVETVARIYKAVKAAGIAPREVKLA